MAIKRNKDGKFAANPGGRMAPTASRIPGKRGPQPGTKQNPESGRAIAARERRERRLEAVTAIIRDDIANHSKLGYSTLSSEQIAELLPADVSTSPASVRASIAQLIKEKRLVRATRRMAGIPGEPAWSQWTRNALALPDANVRATKSVLRQEAEVAERHHRYVTTGKGRWRRKRLKDQNSDVAIVARENTPSAIKIGEVETIAGQLAAERKQGRFRAAERYTGTVDLGNRQRNDAC